MGLINIEYVCIQPKKPLVSIFVLYNKSPIDPYLTHCSLVMPYGDIDLGKHWHR